MMTNKEKIDFIQDGLINITYDLVNDMNEQKDYGYIEQNINLLNDLTTNIKRIADLSGLIGSE